MLSNIYLAVTILTFIGCMVYYKKDPHLRYVQISCKIDLCLIALLVSIGWIISLPIILVAVIVTKIREIILTKKD